MRAASSLSLLMFRRKIHRRVARILQALDAQCLSSSKCWFGGGTRIVLELDEYRESAGIDFLCADVPGFRALRQGIHERSLGRILRAPLALAREVRADQYGIRTFFDLGDGEMPIKFEIIREARLAISGEPNAAIGLAVLDRVSCLAEKLLAIADRGLDRSTHSRDVLDLAMMVERWPRSLAPALKRAETAYGSAIRRGLAAAAALYLADKAYSAKCLRELRMTRGALPLERIRGWAGERKRSGG